MKNFGILSEPELINRRYPSFAKTRKDWNCQRYGLLVEKGERIEHSYSADRTQTIELCIPCVEKLAQVENK